MREARAGNGRGVDRQWARHAQGVGSASTMRYTVGNGSRMDKVDKICNFLGIERTDLLEPRKTSAPQSIDDLDFTGINRIAAHFSGDDFSEEDLNEIQSFINYVKQKNKNKEK